MSAKDWILPQPVQVPPELQDAVDGHPLVAETLVRRGITSPDAARRFLDPAHYTPADAFDLPDMDRAVERIERAIADGERICVWGDFDVDGQTATTLLVSALRELGAEVIYYIPNRHTEGHGMDVGRLASLIDTHALGMVLTCDTGIAEHEGVDYCNQRGVDVVITDHHQLPPQLPDAYAAVNPQRLDATHPLHTLPGVGCAYKLVEALYARRDWGERTTPFLDLVALGIVADVATQTGDTRYLLQRGLDVLRTTERLGLQTMMKNADIIADQIDAETIGFGFGPRMNALGRLGDANEAVELLTTDDPATAQILANRLEGLNNERRNQTNQIYEAALAQIDADENLLNYSVLVLDHERWSGGVVGIVASRLAEKFNRPVILLVSPPDEPAHGSARSVEGVDITAAIARHSDLLLGFGGHTQAAGMSLPPENIPAFRRALSVTVREMRGAQEATAPLHIDATLPLHALSLDLVDDLGRLAPFGTGNPALVLATERVRVSNSRTLGRDGKHLRVVIEDEQGDTREVVWWNAEELPETRFDLAYIASANTFKGERRLQLTWLDARLRDEPITDFSQRRDVSIIDHRNALNPEKILRRFLRDCDERVTIWQEGTPRQNVGGIPRYELQPAPVLVVWTAPPGIAVWQDALQRVNPGTIVLFAVDPLADSVNGFLQRLGGAVKHVLKAKEGRTTLDALGGVLAHDPATIRLGLMWMQQRGHITYHETDDGTLHLTGDGTPDATHNKAESTAKLAQALGEAAHFRAYFHKLDTNNLTE